MRQQHVPKRDMNKDFLYAMQSSRGGRDESGAERPPETVLESHASLRTKMVLKPHGIRTRGVIRVRAATMVQRKVKRLGGVVRNPEVDKLKRIQVRFLAAKTCSALHGVPQSDAM